jgi:hypothetical protein
MHLDESQPVLSKDIAFQQDAAGPGSVDSALSSFYRDARIWLLIGDKRETTTGRTGCQPTDRTFQLDVDVRRLRSKTPSRVAKRLPQRPQYVDGTECGHDHAAVADLVITVVRRPSMVALWVKEQSRGQPRIAHRRTSRRWLSRFSLIIAAAHHHVPVANVIRLGLPLIKADASEWRLRARGDAGVAGNAATVVRHVVGGPTKPRRCSTAKSRSIP